MKQTFILVPLANIKSSSLDSQLQAILKMPRNRFSTHEFQEGRICIEIQDFTLPFLQINHILTDYNQVSMKLAMLEEVLEKVNIDFLQPPIENLNEYSNIQELVKKASKAKKLKEQNKKLKNLLQIQLQNTQKVRQQTQKTMKVLKDEFDALVQEMNKRQESQVLRVQNHYSP